MWTHHVQSQFLTSSSTMELLIYEWDPILFISYTQMCSRTGDEMHILSHYYTDQQVAVTQQHVL